ncbi:MAG TPA: hypothetical protein IAA98_15685 [Candidatus Avipropionibacterium avicola]|uniref:RidA family protein n=1 Tax=Candidatus Avipropionibacterium avicola TaxID=2840701 RepID=A0A9D1H0S3_9ACTN|nr:hypothetical protein [Candidatus Avipropionibacterium avicola]
MARLRDSGHGYDFLPASGRHAAAVLARPGHQIQRVELAAPVVHELAFELIAQHLRDLGLPGGALCALELRSPAQFSDPDFADHHRRYRSALAQLGIEVDDRTNPIARSNAVPTVDPPVDVSVHAFSHVVPVVEYEGGGLARLERTFVVSGSGEVPEDTDRYADHIVARGDLSPEGLTRKIRWVVAEMKRRLHAIKSSWADVTRTQVYCTRDVGSLLPVEVQDVTGRDIDWFACQPPVVELEFEMDCRRTGVEVILEPAVS